MSVIDIRLGENFYEHYKTVALEKRLGIQASRSLTILWLWAARNRADGILRNLNEESIESAAKWPGENGAFVKALTELRWLDIREDGTYELHEWRQHNQWAARKDDRADATRFSGMARNYPELYQQLKEQGATRITSEEYEKLITEYHESEKNKSSSVFLRMHCESHTPAPAPMPLPLPEPKKESAAEIFYGTSETPKTLIMESAPIAPTVNATLTRQENPSIRPECLMDSEQRVYMVNLEAPANTTASATQAMTSTSPTTQTASTSAGTCATTEHSQAAESPAKLAAVIAIWNKKLAPAGFPAIKATTTKRDKLFRECVAKFPEAATMDFWQSFLARVCDSEFLCEKRAKSGASWITIDWVLKEDHFVSILEGKYDNSRYANVNAAKKNAKQTKATPSQETPATESKPIALPATIAELYTGLQKKQQELDGYLALSRPVDEDGNCIYTDENGNEIPDPEITFEDYLHVKFPNATEEELHTDYEGNVHGDYSDFPQAGHMKLGFEAERACALCESPEHCALPEEIKSKIRMKTGWLTVGLCRTSQGMKFLGTKNALPFVCKHKCAGCGENVPDGGKITAGEVIGAVNRHSGAIALPARMPSSTQSEKKADSWKDDGYERELADIEAKRKQALEILASMQAEEEAKAQATETAGTPEVASSRSDVATSSASVEQTEEAMSEDTVSATYDELDEEYEASRLREWEELKAELEKYRQDENTDMEA